MAVENQHKTLEKNIGIFWLWTWKKIH
jgi:hypothetical protein